MKYRINTHIDESREDLTFEELISLHRLSMGVSFHRIRVSFVTYVQNSHWLTVRLPTSLLEFLEVIRSSRVHVRSWYENIRCEGRLDGPFTWVDSVERERKRVCKNRIRSTIITERDFLSDAPHLFSSTQYKKVD